MRQQFGVPKVQLLCLTKPLFGCAFHRKHFFEDALCENPQHAALFAHSEAQSFGVAMLVKVGEILYMWSLVIDAGLRRDISVNIVHLATSSGPRAVAASVIGVDGLVEVDVAIRVDGLVALVALAALNVGELVLKDGMVDVDVVDVVVVVVDGVVVEVREVVDVGVVVAGVCVGVVPTPALPFSPLLPASPLLPFSSPSELSSLPFSPFSLTLRPPSSLSSPPPASPSSPPAPPSLPSPPSPPSPPPP